MTQPNAQPSLSGPAPNMGSPQAEQTQNQQPGNVRDLPPTASTPKNDPGGATKPQGPVNAPAAAAQGNQPASTVTW